MLKLAYAMGVKRALDEAGVSQPTTGADAFAAAAVASLGGGEDEDYAEDPKENYEKGDSPPVSWGPEMSLIGGGA
jgi:hypothetical protein